jgi:hypothetical protein
MRPFYTTAQDCQAPGEKPPHSFGESLPFLLGESLPFLSEKACRFIFKNKSFFENSNFFKKKTCKMRSDVL